jgi:hypothetical protein
MFLPLLATPYGAPLDGRGLRSKSLARVSATVWLFTGKYHDREVADLLNAAALALGQKADFDAPEFAKARLRHKSKKSLAISRGTGRG